MLNIIIKTAQNNIFFIFFFIIILRSFNAFYNTYSVLTSDYEKRLVYNYGYCQKESWGFYNFVINEYNLQDQAVKIINQSGAVKINNLFKNIKEDKNKINKYLMILNLKSINEETVYDMDIKDIKKYKIKYRYNSCYLMELND